MAKDPAFLFYPADFMIGTALMNFEQKGKYVSLLCYQHQLGHLNKEDMIAVCGEDKKIFSKFKQDENGLYYNQRLEDESVKRNSFCASRKKSRTSNVRQSYVERMENVNEDENTVKQQTPKEYDLSWPISYLNQLLGTRYSTKEVNTAFVKARYSEGRTQNDFKTVIDKKVAQWRSDENMAKYLRPETLFNRTKFESYLNEITKAQAYEKIWPKHPKSCPECFGNGYIIAPGSGGRFSCREVFN